MHSHWNIFVAVALQAINLDNYEFYCSSTQSNWQIAAIRISIRFVIDFSVSSMVKMDG